MVLRGPYLLLTPRKNKEKEWKNNKTNGIDLTHRVTSGEPY